MSFTREIVERRVLPVVGVYIGACWVVVEILDRLVERYFLSPFITDVVFWGLFSLVPAVILLAWTHGRPGRDRVTRAEKIGIPINLIATVGLLLTVFGDKDLSATADLVTLANELGHEESHYIPRESYRRRLAMFFWDREGDDPELEWLQYGVTDLLTQDLQQNPFLLASSPWDNPADGFYPEMKEAGFDDGLAVPLTLKREIASQADRDYFVDGTIGRGDRQYRAVARIWETESLELVDEISAQGFDLLKVVDSLSEGILELLDTPPGFGDLPLVETYGESESALRDYVLARNAVLFENDRDKANRLYDRSLAADPDFVLSWHRKSLSLWQQGNAAGAQDALEQAQRLSYRLPENDRVNVKLMAYRIGGEQEKVETLLRMRTQIVGDAASYGALGQFLMLAGELEEAKTMFRRQMEADRSADSALLQLAQLERSTGNVEAAIEHALDYMELQPDDLDPLLLLGNLYQEAGDMESARASFERAQVIEDPPVNATLALAILAIKQGEWIRARALIGEARELSATARHAILVLQVEGYLEQRLGRITVAIDRVEEQVAYNQQALNPVEQVFNHDVPLIQHYVSLDRLEEAEKSLAAARRVLQSPMDKFLAFSEVLVAARTGDLDRANEALRASSEVIEHFKADFLSFMVSISAAEIAEAEGDYSRAGRHYQDAIRELNRSVVAGGMMGGRSLIYGACAQAHIRAGELDAAQRVLDYAFQRDSAEPSLWVARALLQEAQGSPRMALASVNYALAVWAEADPDYVEFQDAVALRQQLEARSN